MSEDAGCTGHEDDPLTRLHDDIAELVRLLDELDEDTRRRIPDLSVVVAVTDLERIFTGRLQGGRAVDRMEEPLPHPLPAADVRITTTAPVVHELVHHDLSFAYAWSSGQLGVRAGVGVLLSLRKFL